MNCARCGVELAEGAEFCHKCGQTTKAESVWNKPIGKPGQASSGLKNAILAVVLVLLLIFLVVVGVTCSGCVAAFGS